MLATGYDRIMDEWMSKHSIFNVRALARAVDNTFYDCFSSATDSSFSQFGDMIHPGC